MSTLERIQLRRAKGWRLPAGAVVVGRPGPWGNPFKVGVDGSADACVSLYRWLLAGNVCLSCKTDVNAQLAARHHAIDHIGELRGKSLACWCRLDQPCHADVLMEIANR